MSDAKYKIGDRVHAKDSTHDSDGEVILVDDLEWTTYPYKVLMDNGKEEWFSEDELTPSQGGQGELKEIPVSEILKGDLLKRTFPEGSRVQEITWVAEYDGDLYQAAVHADSVILIHREEQQPLFYPVNGCVVLLTEGIHRTVAVYDDSQPKHRRWLKGSDVGYYSEDDILIHLQEDPESYILIFDPRRPWRENRDAFLEGMSKFNG